MSVVALVIAPTIAIDIDAMAEKIEKPEHTITIEAERESDMADNSIRYEEVVKK